MIPNLPFLDPLYDSVEQQQQQPHDDDDDDENDVVWSKNAVYDRSSFTAKPNAKNKVCLTL